MKVDDFDYALPPERIAQHPCEERDRARLLAHDVGANRTEHRIVRDLPSFLRAGDLLVVNDTRVVPTRLHGRRATGGRVEFLLLEPAGEERWLALANPARKLRAGERIPVQGGRLEVTLVERTTAADGAPGKEWIVALEDPEGRRSPSELLEEHGSVPLPPYIRRDAEAADSEGVAREDRARYQTVYADKAGAVAAPTAGLHFTPELFARLDELGVRRAAVTLHVGHGTFQPVQAEEVTSHRMHFERYTLSADVAEAIAETREAGGRVVCVGTTSVRVLETCADPARPGHVLPASGETNLFLYPGRRLAVVDALLTNFHLPRSSLLFLVSALAGRERILELYREAVEREYRFFSYGDAMLLYGVPDSPASSV